MRGVPHLFHVKPITLNGTVGPKTDSMVYSMHAEQIPPTGAGHRRPVVRPRRRAAGVLHLCGGGAPGRRGRRAVDGGTVRIGALTDLRPETLYAAATTAEHSASGLVFDTLTSYETEDSTAALTPQPALAESWDVSGDGLTVTLHLRPGVLFHDGTPFTSDNVKASLTDYADPTHSGQLARTAALISEVDTSDPATAVLHLDRRVNNLFDLFDIVPVIDDKEVDAFNAGTGFNGTGAFRFGERHPGASLDLPANEQYWGGGRAWTTRRSSSPMSAPSTHSSAPGSSTWSTTPVPVTPKCSRATTCSGCSTGPVSTATSTPD